MPFELPNLPYPYDALEPHIDAETMRIHHDLHHKAYVDNANAALDGTEWADRPVETVLGDLEIVPEEKRTAVRNNAGGHANHSLFWQIMSPDGGGAPGGALGDAVDAAFGGFDQLKAALNDGGVKRFGSGWTWLVWDGTGLSTYSTAEPGLAVDAVPRAPAGNRRVGARVLPQVSEQAARLSRGLVERRQLARGRAPLRGGTDELACGRKSRGSADA